jgi:hypothetical protein
MRVHTNLSIRYPLGRPFNYPQVLLREKSNRLADFIENANRLCIRGRVRHRGHTRRKPSSGQRLCHADTQRRPSRAIRSNARSAWAAASLAD